MRGSQSIYHNLFNEAVAEPVPQLSLRTKKIEAIVDFYYYTGRKDIIVNGKPVRISYTSLLDVVSSTFFLSTFTIHDIIQANMDKVAMVKQEWKDKPIYDLRKAMIAKWPMFVW